MLPNDIIEACERNDFFRPWFRDPVTWSAWFAFLRAVFGIVMNQADLAIFEECTGRTDSPPGGARETWLICGRRAGKSFIIALIAAFLATMSDYSPYLAPGERATIMVVSADRRQSRTIFRYLAGILKNVELLAPLIERETADTIDLSNQVSIEIQTASFRSVRGYAIAACLADEMAFWTTDEAGANPDREILAAIRPAMAQFPNARLLIASSPYARKGELWNAYTRHYGKPSATLVWKAPTKTMNTTVPDSIIAEAMEADPASASAEYFAEFRSDVETFINREMIAACGGAGLELQPISGQQYVAFCDPSGGSSDSMTMALAHFDEFKGKSVLDLVREVRPPFSPAAVVDDFCQVLQRYGVTTVTGDRWGGEFVRELFRVRGVQYNLSRQNKSELYLALLPLMNSGVVELRNIERLKVQLLGLERRTARGGRDSVDHGPGAHDDVVNVAAGALVIANENGGRPGIIFTSLPNPFWPSPQEEAEMWRRNVVRCSDDAKPMKPDEDAAERLRLRIVAQNRALLKSS